MVKCGLDASLIEGYQEAEHNAEGTVTWDNNIDRVTSWINQSHTANGTVYWSNNTNNVQSNFTGYGTIYWKANGSASAQGTAYAGGTWGTKSGGMALGAELGQEIVVRNGRWFTIGDNGAEFFKYQPNDIIFNAEQTRQLLKNGKITNGVKRGVSYAQGTAFSSGYGRITVGGNLQTSASNIQYTSNTSNTSNSTDSDAKSIDWIEIAIKRIEAVINRFKSKADSTFRSFSSRFKNIGNEINAITDEIEIQKAAVDRYMQEANSVGLPENLAILVRQGTIDISKYDEETQKLISSYQEWYEKALQASEAVKDLNDTISELTLDQFNLTKTKFDNQIDRIEAEKSKYEISESKTNSVDKANKKFNKQISLDNKEIKKAQQEASELTRQRNEAVASGKIKKGSEAWHEMTAAIEEANQKIRETNEEIASLTLDKFNFTAEKYSNRLDIINARKESYSISDSKTNSTKKANRSYNAQIAADNKSIKLQKEELRKLEKQRDKAVASGKIKKGSQAWYEMQKQIDSVNASIRETNEEIASLTLDKFNFTAEKYSNRLAQYESRQDTYNYSSSKTTSVKQGSKGYSKQIAIERKEIQLQKEELRKLEKQRDKAVASGKIKKGSKAWYEMQEQINGVSKSISDAHDNIAKYLMDNFDMISKRYENKLSLNQHLTKTVETNISMLQAKGQLQSTRYYKNLSNIEKKNIATMKKELSSLKKAQKAALASGEIKEGSDDWYAMQQEINKVQESIDSANVS